MFGKIFDRFKAPPSPAEPPRTLTHPRDLRTGDIIKIGLCDLDAFSGGEFLIKEVKGLDIDPQSGAERRMLRLDSPHGRSEWTLWLWTEEADLGAADPLALAIEMPQDDVLRRIDGAAFGQMFAPDRSYLVRLGDRLMDDPAVAPQGYREVRAQQAYINSGDPNRLGTSNQITENDRAIDWYRMESDDRRYALEAYVHDGGRTDVLFITYHPLRRIEQMLPAAS